MIYQFSQLLRKKIIMAMNLTLNEGLDFIKQSLQSKDWFYQTSLNENNKIVVYVHYMSEDILRNVPLQIAGHHVLVHFAAAEKAKRDNFTDTVKPRLSQDAPIEEPLSNEDEIGSYDVASLIDLTDELDVDINEQYLISELERLEKICGANILESIFFEEHDGKNAVTNLSIKHPNIRDAIHILYKEYGFDVIYEILYT